MSRLSNRALLATIAAGAVRRVDSYLARDADLASYRTYAWGSAGQGATGDVRLDNNEMCQERVQAAVENHLVGRGLEKTAAEPQLSCMITSAANSASTSPRSNRGSRVWNEGR